MAHSSWSLAERIPQMYTIPATDVMYEQSESAVIKQGRVLVSDDSVRSQASQGSEETLSPNQDGTFSYGAASEPLGSDIEPLMQRHSAKFFPNLDQADVSSVVADTVRQAYTGLGARPQTPDNCMDVASRPLSDTAGPSQPAHTEFSDCFAIEPDTPVFKMPRLPAPRMSTARTNVTRRQTSHEVPMTHDHRPSSRSSTSQLRSRMSTVFTLGHSSPHSSAQKWLLQVTPGAPPPTPTIVTSQAVYELPMGATASALAPQRSRSSRHSHSHGTPVLVTILGLQWQWRSLTLHQR